MKIILKKNVKGIGLENDIKEVKRGYAINYLIPGGFATIRNKKNQKIAEENKRQAAYKIRRRREEAEAIAAKIKETKFVLKAKASTNGKIFGSVTSLQLSSMLKEHDVFISYKKIKLINTVKETGETYEALVTIDQGIEANLVFQVENSDL